MTLGLSSAALHKIVVFVPPPHRSSSGEWARAREAGRAGGPSFSIIPELLLAFKVGRAVRDAPMRHCEFRPLRGRRRGDLSAAAAAARPNLSKVPRILGAPAAAARRTAAASLLRCSWACERGAPRRRRTELPFFSSSSFLSPSLSIAGLGVQSIRMEFVRDRLERTLPSWKIVMIMIVILHYTY